MRYHYVCLLKILPKSMSSKIYGLHIKLTNKHHLRLTPDVAVVVVGIL